MSEALQKAAAALGEKIAGSGFDATARLEVEGEGAIVIDGEQARVAEGDEGEADVTIRASLDTFREIFEGELSATAAFMTGRMEVEGDMGAAMKLGQVLG